jgi:hypothetical protein
MSKGVPHLEILWIAFIIKPIDIDGPADEICLI